MARFQFKFEAVLQHRRRLERQAQVALAERSAIARSLHDQLRELNTRLVRSTDELRQNHLVGKIDVGYLSAHRRFTHDVTDRGAHLLQRIGLAQKGVDEARGLLAEAARQRKAIETLREKYELRWREDQSRRQAAEEDDAAGRLAYENLCELVEVAR
jgi:flagellar export protein FliJ